MSPGSGISGSPLWSASHAKIIEYRLEHYAIPSLGKMAIGAVKAPDVLAMLRKIEKRGSIETEHRVKIVVGQVMRYAVATSRATHDPTVSLRGALPSPEEHHFGALTDPAAVGRLLKLQEAYQGTPSVKAALRLAPLVFVRPGELRGARWSEIDLDRAEWMIPAARMKGQKADHIVPLSRQAVAILRQMIDLRSAIGESPYVFPGYQSRQKPMSETAMLNAYKKMGYRQGEVTAHGWRATARTLLDEQLGFRPEVIEHQLAHTVRDPLGRAYNRTTYLDERRRMMQAWADYLDSLRASAELHG